METYEEIRRRFDETLKILTWSQVQEVMMGGEFDSPLMQQATELRNLLRETGLPRAVINIPESN